VGEFCSLSKREELCSSLLPFKVCGGVTGGGGGSGRGWPSGPMRRLESMMVELVWNLR
jgi:hypothetical protein